MTNTGEHLETRDFPITSTGIKRAITWGGRRTGGDVNTLWVVEGTSSYGAVRTGTVTDAGCTVTETPCGYAKIGATSPKTNPLNVQRMAVAARPVEAGKLRTHG
ncbi:MAG: IS110 family transposase [Acidobacteria bacterium]|nr:IS110 family transposase [Acidobacteriota bacterium]